MLEDQINKLAALIKDEDLKKYRRRWFLGPDASGDFFRPGFSNWGDQKRYRTCVSYADVFVLE